MQGKTLQDFWNSFKEQTKARKDRGKPEFPTGLKFLDEATDGVHKGQVWTVSGKSGSGKTSLSLQIARNVADNPDNSVLFISLEMKGESLVSRMFCEMMREDNGLFKHGLLDLEKDKAFTEYIKGVDIEIVENGYNFNELLKIIESYYGDKKPDLIVIDFAQLIEWKGDQRVSMEEYMRKLTELAKVEGIAILLVSQLRRLPSGADVNREPDMSDMKGSGLLEQMSHVVLIVYRYMEHGNERYSIKIAKNRNGERLSREVNFVGKEYRFEETVGLS